MRTTDFREFEVTKSGKRVVFQNDQVICTMQYSGDIVALNSLKVYKNHILSTAQHKSIIKKLLELKKFKELIGLCDCETSEDTISQESLFDTLEVDSDPSRRIAVLSDTINDDRFKLRKMLSFFTVTNFKPNWRTYNIKEVGGTIRSNTDELIKEIQKLQKQLAQQVKFKDIIQLNKRTVSTKMVQLGLFDNSPLNYDPVEQVGYISSHLGEELIRLRRMIRLLLGYPDFKPTLRNFDLNDIKDNLKKHADELVVEIKQIHKRR